MSGLKFVLITFLSFAALAFEMALAAPESKDSSSEPYVICKNQKIVRTLRIEKENGRCQTIYNKDGKDQVIGNGMYQTSCQKILEDVRKNLMASSWKCRDIKDSAVSELGEAVTQ